MESKQCCGCGKTKPLDEFAKDARRPKGRGSRCKQCRNAAGRQQAKRANPKKYRGRYKGRYEGRYKETAKRNIKKWYNDNPLARRAHRTVEKAIRNMRLPKIKTAQCIQCGQPAMHYHHHLGYEPEHQLDVIPLCGACHRLAHQID